MTQKISSDGLDLLFRKARTFNGYTDQKLTHADYAEIWELAKMGPTSANQLPARLVWCESDDAKNKLAACASPQNAPKILKAPVTLIIGMDTDFHEHLPEFFPHVDAKAWFDDKPEFRKDSAFRNSSLQGAYVLMAARALGFGTGPMSGFDANLVKDTFFSSQPSVHVNFIMTIGYGDEGSIFGRLPRPEFDRFNEIV